MPTCPSCGAPLQVIQRDGVWMGSCPNCNRQTVLQVAAEQRQTPPSAGTPQFRVAQRAPARATFPVTKTIVGLNVAVFIAMTLTGSSFIEPSLKDLLRWGADCGPFTFDHEWWRALTSMFVHGGILHIGFNMWAFWYLGCLAERIFGRWTYAGVYLATGLASSMASLWIHPVEVSVGASGAIFGVAGALITALKLGKLGIPAQNLKAIIRSLILFAFYNLAFGAAVPFIDNAAHVGGFAFGLIAGALLSRSLTAQPLQRRQITLVIFIALGMALTAAKIGVQHTRGWVVAKYKPAVEQQVNQGK